MADEDAFVAALLDDPGDEATRLVYADWLEERGDARAAAVRRHPEVFAFLSGLRSATDEEKALGPLGEWVFGGRVELLRALRSVLGCTPGEPWAPRPIPGIPAAILGRVRETAFPTPGTAGETVLLRGTGGLHPRSSEVAALASRVASGHPQRSLLAVLERFQGREEYLDVLGCLLHEMVLRGAFLEGVAAAEAVRARLRATGHPLAVLPLHLTPAEGDLRAWLPKYGPLGQSSRGMPFGPRGLPPKGLPVGSPPGGVGDERDPAAAGRLPEAVRDWGVVESRTFLSGIPISEESISVRMLTSLGLDCLAGTAEGDVEAEQIPADAAFALLFSAASSGGAYGGGLGGAHGRLAALRSLAALAGVDAEDAETISEAACRCLWVKFDQSNSDWFSRVAWDIGLLAVRPDRMSLAVLAATDSD